MPSPMIWLLIWSSERGMPLTFTAQTEKIKPVILFGTPSASFVSQSILDRIRSQIMTIAIENTLPNGYQQPVFEEWWTFDTQRREISLSVRISSHTHTNRWCRQHGFYSLPFLFLETAICCTKVYVAHAIYHVFIQRQTQYHDDWKSFKRPWNMAHLTLVLIHVICSHDWHV